MCIHIKVQARYFLNLLSSPFNKLGIVPFGGRSTAIKLQDGNVWVMASTPLSQETYDTIAKLGPVKCVLLLPVFLVLMQEIIE